MFPVSEDEISKAEAEFGASFPSELKEIWKEVGYGFVNTSLDEASSTNSTQLLLAPDQVVSAFFARDEFYRNDSAGKGTPFFDVGDGMYMVLDKDYLGENIVRLSFDLEAPDVMANGIEDFLNKILLNPTFWADRLA
jgi:hypothetical protein